MISQHRLKTLFLLSNLYNSLTKQNVTQQQLYKTKTKQNNRFVCWSCNLLCPQQRTWSFNKNIYYDLTRLVTSDSQKLFLHNRVPLQ